jgi:hypothetical protein
MVKKILILILFFSQALSAQQLSWPEITRENKPWTRWWWPGSIVTPADITANMEKYHKAGLGGMEIAVIYGVKGQEDKFINYLSPRWMEMFIHALKESERLDMGIELANASGWPFGGPWVNPGDACKNINYNTYRLGSGQSLNEKIEFIQQPLVRPVGERPDITKLKYPISKNENLQLYALDQIRFEMPLPLQVLMAYSDNGKSVDLTDKVDADGRLDWIAPEGTWTLYALFQGWHGKMAERAGPGGEGDVIDHFSAQAIDNYLKHFDKIFKDYDLKLLRGYFNDSYEVDDASGQSNWTPLLFDEFIARRGYDLRDHLPALFQNDTPEKNERVLCDYRETISDLILETFTTRWTSWANKQGKTTRNQSHGSPGNILDLYAASDIPETEGNEITRFKFASSAANVSGKKYASAEAATWLNEHFSSSLSDVKKAVDLFFLGGINHIFYHGTCFSPVNEPWPGFHFYAAVEFNPSNSFWNDFEGLNSYVGRTQSFLQRGKPDNDVLLYFPIYDRYSDYGRGLLEHFDGISQRFNDTPFKTTAEYMLEKGFAYDFVSDMQLKNMKSVNGLIQTGGGKYKTVVVPGSKYIPLETFEKLLELAKEGACIIFYNGLPENISGFCDYESKGRLFTQLKAGIKFVTIEDKNLKKASAGKGYILSGNDLGLLLSEAGIVHEIMTDKGIQFLRRKSETGSYYFVLNQGNDPFEGWLPLGRKALSAALFNPMTGEYGLTETRTGSNESYEIHLNIKPWESFIIETFSKPVSGKEYTFYEKASLPVVISGSWKVDFIEGGPVFPSSREISSLVSWTEFGGEEVKNFSGTARYTISFKKPAGKADAWIISLGKVCESARITLNGKEIAILIGPDFQVVVDKKTLRAKNALEIKVSNLMANGIAYMDRNNIKWKKFYNVNMAARMRQNTKNGIFDASAWEPRESGLIGPVTITAVKKR